MIDVEPAGSSRNMQSARQVRNILNIGMAPGG